MKRYILPLVLTWLAVTPTYAQTTISFNTVIDQYGYGLNFYSGGFNFSINDPGNEKQIVGRQGQGYNGTNCLYDNNLVPGNLKRWTIARNNASTFRMKSIFLKDAGFGAIASGTITGYRNGVMTGPAENINFNGLLDFTNNSKFYNVDEIRIEGSDINVYLDEFTHDVVVTLPLELLSFNGKPSAIGNQLQWKTTNESNFKGFELQSAGNDKVFVPITFVGANGNGNYSYTHTQAKQGTNYYRLKMVDNDGTFSFSDIIALEFTLNSEQALVYPVPFKNVLNLQNAKGGLKIIDTQGKTVHQQQIKADERTAINLTALPAGTYFLQLQKADGSVTVKKAVKE